MQQVHPIGLRLGVTQNWDFTKVQYQKNGSDRYWLYQLLVRREISKYGCFVLNSYYYNTKDESFNAVIVFYRYIQRGRMSSYLSRLIQGSSMLLAPPFMRIILARRFDFIRPQSAFLGFRLLNWKRQSRRIDLWKYRGGQVYLPYKSRRRRLRKQSAKALRAWIGLGGYIDMELSLLGPEYVSYRRTFAYRLRKKLMDQLFTNYQTNVQIYNISQFFRTARLTGLTSHYTMKRYRRLLYWRDAIFITFIAARLNTSHLVAHVISLGLERHGTRRKQTSFLHMYKAVLDRLISWSEIKRKPMDWRISVYGRLDANIRRQHILIEVGTTSYQSLDVLTNYSAYTAKSKFSTTSVRVWIRNLIHWRKK